MGIIDNLFKTAGDLVAETNPLEMDATEIIKKYPNLQDKSLTPSLRKIFTQRVANYAQYQLSKPSSDLDKNVQEWLIANTDLKLSDLTIDDQKQESRDEASEKLKEVSEQAAQEQQTIAAYRADQSFQARTSDIPDSTQAAKQVREQAMRASFREMLGKSVSKNQLEQVLNQIGTTFDQQLADELTILEPQEALVSAIRQTATRDESFRALVETATGSNLVQASSTLAENILNKNVNTTAAPADNLAVAVAGLTGKSISQTEQNLNQIQGSSRYSYQKVVTDANNEALKFAGIDQLKDQSAISKAATGKNAKAAVTQEIATQLGKSADDPQVQQATQTVLRATRTVKKAAGNQLKTDTPSTLDQNQVIEATKSYNQTKKNILRKWEKDNQARHDSGLPTKEYLNFIHGDPQNPSADSLENLTLKRLREKSPQKASVYQKSQAHQDLNASTLEKDKAYQALKNDAFKKAQKRIDDVVNKHGSISSKEGARIQKEEHQKALKIFAAQNPEKAKHYARINKTVAGDIKQAETIAPEKQSFSKQEYKNVKIKAIAFSDLNNAHKDNSEANVEELSQQAVDLINQEDTAENRAALRNLGLGRATINKLRIEAGKEEQGTEPTLVEKAAVLMSLPAGMTSERSDIVTSALVENTPQSTDLISQVLVDEGLASNQNQAKKMASDLIKTYDQNTQQVEQTVAILNQAIPDEEKFAQIESVFGAEKAAQIKQTYAPSAKSLLKTSKQARNSSKFITVHNNLESIITDNLKKAGYNNEEIAEYLNKTVEFNYLDSYKSVSLGNLMRGSHLLHTPEETAELMSRVVPGSDYDKMLNLIDQHRSAYFNDLSNVVDMDVLRATFSDKGDVDLEALANLLNRGDGDPTATIIAMFGKEGNLPHPEWLNPHMKKADNLLRDGAFKRLSASQRKTLMNQRFAPVGRMERLRRGFMARSIRSSNPIARWFNRGAAGFVGAFSGGGATANKGFWLPKSDGSPHYVMSMRSRDGSSSFSRLKSMLSKRLGGPRKSVTSLLKRGFSALLKRLRNMLLRNFLISGLMSLLGILSSILGALFSLIAGLITTIILAIFSLVFGTVFSVILPVVFAVAIIVVVIVLFMQPNQVPRVESELYFTTEKYVVLAEFDSSCGLEEDPDCWWPRLDDATGVLTDQDGNQVQESNTIIFTKQEWDDFYNDGRWPTFKFIVKITRTPQAEGLITGVGTEFLDQLNIKARGKESYPMFNINDWPVGLAGPGIISEESPPYYEDYLLNMAGGWRIAENGSEAYSDIYSDTAEDFTSPEFTDIALYNQIQWIGQAKVPTRLDTPVDENNPDTYNEIQFTNIENAVIGIGNPPSIDIDNSAIASGCPASIWPVDTSQGQRYFITQGVDAASSHGGGATIEQPDGTILVLPFQEALDINPEPSTPYASRKIITPVGGEVIHSRTDQFGGKYVDVQASCDSNVKIRFVHMDSVTVTEGQTLSTGDEIGVMGCTGYCGGDHLHYEFRTTLLPGGTRNRNTDGPPYMDPPFIPTEVPMGCIGRSSCNVDIP